MNKKITLLLTDKLPIVSLIILILAYIYLSIPDNYALQVGGVVVANTFKLPENTPWKYKYRWLLISVPFLLIFSIIYSRVVRSNIASLTIWDQGKDFFSQFQREINNAVTGGQVQSADAKNFNYLKLDLNEELKTSNPNTYKLFNVIMQTANPNNSLYQSAQYFCSTTRPCSCCDFPKYKTFFTTNNCPKT